MQKRRRFKQTQSLEERLAQDIAHLREKVAVLPPGPAKAHLVRRITQNEAARELCEMLRSPSMKSPY